MSGLSLSDPHDRGELTAAQVLLEEAVPDTALRIAVVERLRQRQKEFMGEPMELKARILFLVEHPDTLSDLLLECS